MAGDGRPASRASSRAGTALRAVKVVSASSRPWSSAGGWIERVRSRSSVMAAVALP